MRAPESIALDQLRPVMLLLEHTDDNRRFAAGEAWTDEGRRLAGQVREMARAGYIRLQELEWSAGALEKDVMRASTGLFMTWAVLHVLTSDAALDIADHVEPVRHLADLRDLIAGSYTRFVELAQALRKPG